MPSCIVYKCGMSTSKKRKEKHENLRFFSFPRDEKMQKKWLLAINRENINMKHARVCSRHFEEKSYKKDWRTEMYNYHPSTARALLPDAVPLLNLLPASKTSKKPSNPQKSPKSLNPQKSPNPPKSQNLPKSSNPQKSANPQKSLNPQKSPNPQKSLNLPKSPNPPEPDPMETSAPMEPDQDQNPQISSEDERLTSALSTLQQEVKRLTQENTKLRAELARSKTKKQYELLEDDCLKLSERLKTCVPKSEVVKLLRKMFTPGQIRAILLPHRRKVLWSAEDISSALTLRGVSARAYDYLKSKRNVPLPGQSTLRKWLGRMKLERGVLSSVLRLMEQKSGSMGEGEKLAVLSFGDGDVKKSRVHCVMLRGLLKRWKQPVYCDGKGFGKEGLLELIAEVERVGFRVVAIVSGVEQRNLKVLRELGVGEEGRNYLVHGERKIFVFGDASCLFKSLKSCFLESGLVFDGKSITKECLKGQRSKVDLSREVAKEVAIAGGAGDLEGHNWEETTEFIVIINDWLDLFNSSADFGAGEDEVKKVERMTQVMEEQGSKDILGVQDLVMMNNRSLQQMLDHLKETCSVESFNPRRLGLDPLKQLFSYLNSGKEGKHRHLDLKTRLRWYMLGDDAGSRLSDGDRDRDEVLIKDLFECEVTKR